MNRGRGGDRGSATVLALTLVFAFMTGALLWLSRTVDRQLGDRTQAAAVAYEAARAGAQQIDVGLTTDVAVLDPERAQRAARAAVQAALDADGDSGHVDAVVVDGAQVTVTVTITTSGRPATGTGTATARVGFDAG